MVVGGSKHSVLPTSPSWSEASHRVLIRIFRVNNINCLKHDWPILTICYDCENPGLSDYTPYLSEGHYWVTADSVSPVLVILFHLIKYSQHDFRIFGETVIQRWCKSVRWLLSAGWGRRDSVVCCDGVREWCITPCHSCGNLDLTLPFLGLTLLLVSWMPFENGDESGC